MVKLSNYCNENGFTQEEKRKIIIDCKLKPDSPDDLVEVALKYASDMKEQKSLHEQYQSRKIHPVAKLPYRFMSHVAKILYYKKLRIK